MPSYFNVNPFITSVSRFLVLKYNTNSPPFVLYYIDFPGLNRVARKLGLDCVPAMTGWDNHSGYSHPVLDGWIVCEEDKDVLIAAWDEQQEIDRQREAEVNVKFTCYCVQL